MRLFFLIITFFFFVSVKAQTISSPTLGIAEHNQVHLINTNSKWSLSSYRGLSTTVPFFRGANAIIFSAPLGLQLNRRISNNLYAFADVTVAPSYISINPSYLSALNKNFNNNPFNQNNFGLYPSATLGLMYTNEAKTFSISGSVSAEKSVYPVFPYYPVNYTTQSR